MSYLGDEVVCPYCLESFDVETSDGQHYRDGESESDYCPNCDKQIMIYSSCTWTREATKADCLNGISDHKWSDWNKHHPTANFTKWFATRYCEMCDERNQGLIDITNDPDEQRILKMYIDIENRHKDERIK